MNLKDKTRAQMGLDELYSEDSEDW